VLAGLAEGGKNYSPLEGGRGVLVGLAVALAKAEPVSPKAEPVSSKLQRRRRGVGKPTVIPVAVYH